MKQFPLALKQLLVGPSSTREDFVDDPRYILEVQPTHAVGWDIGATLDERRAKLAQKRLRSHARNRTKLGDEMRLVIVPSEGRDACPVRLAAARCTERPTETGELCKGLRAHADGFAERSAEVTLAHAKIGSDLVHVGGCELLGGLEGKLHAIASSLRMCDAFDNRALEDPRRVERIARDGKSIDELLRRNAA